MVPQELKYTKDHEWIKVEGDVVTIGVTDHAQSELGDITFVEIPTIGSESAQGDSLATVESVKAASDVYAPVTGKTIEANDALENTPELINQSPYEEGWICKIQMEDASQIDSLLDADAYSKLLEEK